MTTYTQPECATERATGSADLTSRPPARPQPLVAAVGGLKAARVGRRPGQGAVWGVMALLGTWAGVQLRPVFGLSRPPAGDSVC